nr:MAG TPA: hypothetical protein [Caudoviricetes sp.]
MNCSFNSIRILQLFAKPLFCVMHQRFNAP